MSSGDLIPIRVALRCRPLVPKEISEGCQPCLHFIKGEPQVILGQDRTFTYDYVFDPNSTQKEVYDQAVARLVKGIFKGYNATVLAYGQTGSGKTYTMGGSYGMCTNPDDDEQGVIPRVVWDLFRGIEQSRDEYIFTVQVSYIELYKEELIDLLEPPNKRRKDAVQIREENSGIKVVGLTEMEVHNADETLACLDTGAKNRTTGATAMNAYSSRSHAIFTLLVEKKSKKDVNDVCCAKFHLVDLAGSERAKKTQAEGERFKEGVNINMGLLALGNVISALGDETQKRLHIPYRDSKLTRLLQDSLGGNSHTVMVACVSPADSNMEETLSTLRYADRARKIKNKPIVNRDPQAAEIFELKQMVRNLQLQLIQSGKTPNMINSSSSTLSDNSIDIKELKERCDLLESEKKKLSHDLTVQMAQNSHLLEQIILLEMKNEKLMSTLDKIKEKTGMSVSRLETTHSLGLVKSDEGEHEPESPDSVLKTIYEQINTIECEPPFAMSTILEEGENGAISQTGSPGSDNNNSSLSEEEQQSKQAIVDFQQRLTELNAQLHQKETVVKQMLQNDEAMAEMKSKYENDKMKLVKQIEQLNDERDELLQKLETSKHNKASAKVAEQHRKRLKELEQQLTEAKETLKTQSRIVRLKEQSDQQLKKMQEEIQEMKRARVQLFRQMKVEAEKFKKYKQAKDKEVMQLKAKERKREIELMKIKRTNEQQQAVLRRKAEQAAAANKRLKEALSRQKAVSEERNRKLEASDMSGIGDRVRKWLSQELEVLVSIADAKYHLDVLKQDRAELGKQKAALEEQLNNGPSPAKKRSCGGVAEDSEATEKIKREIKMLESEISLRSAQIADLQEKVMDAAPDDKAKSRWNNIHTMMEAKCAMKYLFNETINSRVEESKLKTKLAEAIDQYQAALADVNKLEKTISDMKTNQQEEILDLQRTYENKMLYLMNQLKNSSNLDSTQDEELKRRLKFQEKQIETLVHFQEDLEMKIAECESLKKEITRLNYQLSLGHEGSLMPGIDHETPLAKATSRIESKDVSRFFSPVFLKKKKLKTENSKDAETLDLFESDDDFDAEDDQDKDPDWQKTPLISKTRTYQAQKRKTMTFKQPGNENSSDPSLADIPNIEQPCCCSGKCIRYCPCRKNRAFCGEGCNCLRAKCTNREQFAETEESTEHPSLQNTTYCLSEPTLDVDGMKENLTDTTTNNDVSVENKLERINFSGASKKKRKLHNASNTLFPPIQA